MPQGFTIFLQVVKRCIIGPPMPLESGRRNYAMSVDSQDRTLSAAQEQTFLAARIEDLYMSYER
jgi:hypothetical protein